MSKENYLGTGDAATIADVARQSLDVQALNDDGNLVVLLEGDGGQRVVDLEQYGARPHRVRAHRTLNTPESFALYLDKHSLEETEVWADLDTSKIVAVIDSNKQVNAGASGEAGWEGHRATLLLRHSPQWKTWVENSDKPMKQQAFAEFIEDNLRDIVEPSHGQMLEIAQSLDAKTNVDFKSASRLSNGQVKFAYVEETKAKAGEAGDIEVPETFRIAIRPYLGGTVYGITVRFRYRVTQSGLVLFYKLERTQDILEAAFGDIVKQLEDGVAPVVNDGQSVGGVPALRVPILYGQPGTR